MSRETLPVYINHVKKKCMPYLRFNDCGLRITLEVNEKTVDLLDKTLNLKNEGREATSAIANVILLYSSD